ncbi:MAG: putative phosphohistidine phosphatase, SixA [Bacteroidetes bacterium]|nr:putative phosphohistidine phosphatase, SixA [Bacteroidota bacterium]
MTIYLLRHGDAVDTPAVHDSDRPLSNFGQRQATAAGRYLAKTNAEIGQILCSTSLRARQTAEAIQRELPSVPVGATELLASSSDPRDIIHELQKTSFKSVLMVGHEPHLSRTLSLLLWGDPRSRVEMKKCSLACISVSDPLEEGRGVLQWLMSSDQTIRG